MSRKESDALTVLIHKLPKIADSLQQIADNTKPPSEEPVLNSIELRLISMALNFLECNIEDGEVEDILGISYDELIERSKSISKKLKIER